MRDLIPRSSSIMYTYAEITNKAFEDIQSYMRAASRATGAEATTKREIAYGIYLGWRSLVESYVDQPAYLADDRKLESLLAG